MENINYKSPKEFFRNMMKEIEKVNKENEKLEKEIVKEDDLSSILIDDIEELKE
jgi:hypothetical protein